MKMDSEEDIKQKADEDEEITLPRKILRLMRKNLLLILLLLSLLVGIGLGAALRTVKPPFDTRAIFYLRFPGDLLMNMLKMLILPLIVSSLISGLASLDARASGKMGLRAIVYYLTTTFLAVIVGIVLTVSIQPGKRGGEADDIPEGEKRIVNTADTFLDLLRQCFPDNLIEMCFRKQVTFQVLQKPTEVIGTTVSAIVNMTTVAMTTMLTTMMMPNQTNSNETDNQTTAPKEVYDPDVRKIDGMNVLGMVVFSIFFGIIIGRMGPRGRPLIDLFDSLCEATMKLVTLVIWYSPIGIMCLVAAKVVEMEDPEKTFEQLLFYFITVIAGLAFHGLITLPLIYFITVRKNPFKFILGVLEPMVTALATSSSSATLPVTMRCLEENNGVDSRVIKFVAPVGATINMDGTALYEAVAVLFIGQMRGIDMNIGQIITVSITATAAAIGAAGVPQAGLVTMVIVLSAVGFPTDDVAIILAVDWLLDRFRTSINVLGDAFGAGIVAHLSRREIRKMDAEDLEISIKQAQDDQELSIEAPAYSSIDEKPKENGFTNLGFQENTAL